MHKHVAKFVIRDLLFISFTLAVISIISSAFDGGARLVLFFLLIFLLIHSFEHRRESTLHGPVDSMVLCSNLIIKTTNNNVKKKVISFTLSRTMDVAQGIQHTHAHDEEKEEIFVNKCTHTQTHHLNCSSFDLLLFASHLAVDLPCANDCQSSNIITFRPDKHWNWEYPSSVDHRLTIAYGNLIAFRMRCVGAFWVYRLLCLCIRFTKLLRTKYIFNFEIISFHFNLAELAGESAEFVRFGVESLGNTRKFI